MSLGVHCCPCRIALSIIVKRCKDTKIFYNRKKKYFFCGVGTELVRRRCGGLTMYN